MHYVTAVVSAVAAIGLLAFAGMQFLQFSDWTGLDILVPSDAMTYNHIKTFALVVGTLALSILLGGMAFKQFAKAGGKHSYERVGGAGPATGGDASSM